MVVCACSATSDHACGVLVPIGTVHSKKKYIGRANAVQCDSVAHTVAYTLAIALGLN